MQQLLTFFFTYRVTFVFLFLQVLALLLVYQNNQYQRLVWLSSANQVIGSLTAVRAQVSGYAELGEKNTALATENSLLRLRLKALEATYPVPLPDSNAIVAPYRFIPSNVIRHSVYLTNNFLTLDKGSSDGIRPGMALTTGVGVVGRVKSVSENFATAYPIIHPKFGVSVKPSQDDQLFSVQWKGGSPREANLMQVSRGARISVGDTVVTSGKDAIFPEGFPVAIIKEVKKEQGAGFLDVTLDLLVDFSRLSYVYAIDSRFKAERDSLEKASFPEEK